MTPYTLGEEHDEPFLVLASDGLWDVLSNDEVAYITRRVSIRTLTAVVRETRPNSTLFYTLSRSSSSWIANNQELGVGREQWVAQN